MKLTQSLLILLSLLPATMLAAEIQSIDVVLDSLHYKTPEGGKGEAGDLRFRSLDFYSDEIFLNLYDEGAVFDSTLHVRPDFLGIRGKNHALGIKLDTTGLQTIKDLDLGRSAIGFNEKRISFDSESLALEHESADVDLKNFSFNCKKHPKYSGNDLDALKYGCLSDSTFSSLDKTNPVELSATLKELDEEGTEAKVSTNINKVEFKTDRILMDAASANISLGSDLLVDAEGMKLTCNKNGDLSNFDPNKLVLDCIDDVSFSVKNVSIEATTEGENGREEITVKSVNPAVILDKKEVRVKTEKVEVALPGLSVSGRNIHLSCEKNNENISNKDIGALAATCLDTSRLREMNGALADFSVKLENETLGKVLISSQMRGIDMKKGFFSADVGYTKVNLNNEIVLGSHQLSVGCDAKLAFPQGVKEVKLEDVKFDQTMNSCLNTINLPKTGLFIYNVGRDGQYFVGANSITVSKTLVKADLDGVQLVNREGSTTLFNMKGSCTKKVETEAVDYKAMIGECIQNGQFTIGSMVADEDNDEVPGIIAAYNKLATAEGRSINPLNLVKNLAPSLKNISINAKNGYVTVGVQTKVLGAFRTAILAGDAQFDMKNEKLILDVKKTELPFGISSKTISLMIIKSIIADDRISVDSSAKKIIIDLKY